MAAMTAPGAGPVPLAGCWGTSASAAAQDRLKERRTALRARLDALRAGLADPAALEPPRTRAARDAARRPPHWPRHAGRTALAAADEALAEVRPAVGGAAAAAGRGARARGRLRVAGHQADTAAGSGRAAGPPGWPRRWRPRAEAGRAAAAARPLPALREERDRPRSARPIVARRSGSGPARRRSRASTARRRGAAGAAPGRRRRPPRATGSPSREAISHRRRRSWREERRTAWVRDTQDAETKRQGLLDQYQELKDQRRAHRRRRPRRRAVPPAPGRSAANTTAVLGAARPPAGGGR